jgi:hypothetical protein
MRDEVGGAEREGDPDQIPMVAYDGVDLIAGERHHDRDPPPRSPTPSRRELPGHALVPSELTLQSTQVIESGLDLDHEKRASPAVEGEKVDPAVRPPVDDLDLASRLPALVSETSIEIGRAPSMDGSHDLSFRECSSERSIGYRSRQERDGRATRPTADTATPPPRAASPARVRPWGVATSAR